MNSSKKEEHRKKLAIFLRDIADQLETDTLNKPLTRHTSEFFMSYQFIDQATRENQVQEAMPHVSTKELVKFLFFGWYCYKVLLADKKLPKIDTTSSDNS
jgi:hypothetical protein